MLNLNGFCKGTYTYIFRNIFGQEKRLYGPFDLVFHSSNTHNYFAVTVEELEDGRTLP